MTYLICNMLSAQYQGQKQKATAEVKDKLTPAESLPAPAKSIRQDLCLLVRQYSFLLIQSGASTRIQKECLKTINRRLQVKTKRAER